MSKSDITLVSPKSLGTAIWFLVRNIGKSLTFEERYFDESTRPANGRPMIFALWHGRMFYPMICFRNSGIQIVVSEHRDGEIVTKAMESAGYGAVRGSSTRGGVKALVNMIRLAKQGKQLGFTADGPKGPMWKFQPGAIFVAAKTGLPIVPVTGSARRAYNFSSWDKMQIPMPFTKGLLNVGEPYFVTGGTAPENIERHRLEVERRLTALTLEADEIVGAPSQL